jgi:hypothetical protein
MGTQSKEPPFLSTDAQLMHAKKAFEIVCHRQDDRHPHEGLEK